VFCSANVTDFSHLCGSLFYFLLIPSQSSAKKSGGAKKPLSGFMLFSKEHRAKVKEDNPDITFGGVGKKLGEMWRALSDSEKQAYKDGKK
jgi:HMG (high mobility group) box